MDQFVALRLIGLTHKLMQTNGAVGRYARTSSSVQQKELEVVLEILRISGAFLAFQ